MSSFKIRNYKNGIITLQIETINIEKFLNSLWINGISIKKVKRRNIASAVLEVNLKDYEKIQAIVVQNRGKIKIIKKQGMIFHIIRYKKRWAFYIGILSFIAILYCLSTHIWKIDIITEHNVSPYEIRQQLKSMGIVEGINKSKINLKEIEEGIIKGNENIMWARVRTDGSKLVVDISEKNVPPSIVKDDTPSNIVAKKDAQILRIYSSLGKVVVKPGDIVKTGQILIKGEQGKEGSVYQVRAKGQVIAKIYYEENAVYKIKGIKTERTGNKIENYYFNLNNSKVYLRNSRVNFENYDKEVDNSNFIKKEIYYEKKDININLDCDTVVKKSEVELYAKVIVNLDKSVKIINEAVEYNLQGDDCLVRLLVTVEENIALEQLAQPIS